MSHLKVTQAGLVALATTIVGQVVAFVPQFAPDKAALISGASAVIAASFMLANSVHKLADSNVSTKDVTNDAIDAARHEISKVDFNSLVQTAVDAKSLPDLEAKVAAEVAKVRSALANELAARMAAAVAPPVPVAPAPVSVSPPAA